MKTCPEALNILLVDDEEQICQVIANMILSRCNTASVRIALSGEEAVSLLKREEFDVVITDIFMPGMDGYQLASLVIKEHDTPVVLFTGHRIVEQHFSDEISQGLICCLKKPITMTELEDAIKTALSAKNKKERNSNGEEVRT